MLNFYGSIFTLIIDNGETRRPLTPTKCMEKTVVVCFPMLCRSFSAIAEFLAQLLRHSVSSARFCICLANSGDLGWTPGTLHIKLRRRYCISHNIYRQACAKVRSPVPNNSTNSKSSMIYQIVPFSVTVGDL